jgi:hypothetical protein
MNASAPLAVALGAWRVMCQREDGANGEGVCLDTQQKELKRSLNYQQPISGWTTAVITAWGSLPIDDAAAQQPADDVVVHDVEHDVRTVRSP